MSFDNTTYFYVGTIFGAARYGTLRSTFASHADPDDTNTLQLQLANTGLVLSSGTSTDEDTLVTLLYVDSEIMSYRTATLVGAGQYDLTHMRRGKYGSTIASHATSSKWARIDGGIFRVPYDPGAIGKTVYFKLPSFNVYGQARESLASATAYSYAIKNVDAGMPVADWKPQFANVTQTGVNEFTKTGGTNGGWDAAVSSAVGFSRCQVTCKPADTTNHLMIALNSDPALNDSYTSLDFALYINVGNLTIYESNVAVLSVGSYAVGDLLAIVYDGVMVRYYQNGTKVRETAIGTPYTTLFLDTSFYEIGAKIKELQFGPIGNTGTYSMDDGAVSGNWSWSDTTGVGYCNFC
jgi:hypothetical protein